MKVEGESRTAIILTLLTEIRDRASYPFNEEVESLIHSVVSYKKRYEKHLLDADNFGIGFSESISGIVTDIPYNEFIGKHFDEQKRSWSHRKKEKRSV